MTRGIIKDVNFIKGLVILNIILLAIWLQGFRQTAQKNEVQDLQGKNLSFDELRKYFTNLANKKGAEYAYNVLKIAPVPPNTDMHLLGHVVGDVLYKQQGINGIKVCTQDFRNACSHAIVVGLLLEKGEGILPQIAQACRQAPGGSGAYTMCYHGLGHGVLAYTNYDLPKAVDLCGKTSKSGLAGEEAIQCIGGTIMEIISGGDHDKKTWSTMRPNYLKQGAPFYPCLADFMPQSGRFMCLTYITPYLWETVGANLGNPTSEDFSKSFKLCSQLNESSNRNICFGGFGKEFVGLAASRDIRGVDQMSNEQFTMVYNWCQLAKDNDGIKACLDQALASIYWGGENNRNASIRFCNIMTDANFKTYCFTDLINQVASYINDPNYKKSFCGELPDEFQSQCRNTLTP